MLEVQALHLAAGEARELMNVGEATFRGYIGGQSCRHDVDFAARFDGNVLFVGMKSHRHGRGQRPGSSGPDDGGNFFPASAGSIFAGSSSSAYFTQTVGLTSFSYSTSASASAVSSCMHQ